MRMPEAVRPPKALHPLDPSVQYAFKDTLAKVYDLGPKQQNTLFQCILDAYASSGILPNNPDTWDHIPPTFDKVYSIKGLKKHHSIVKIGNEKPIYLADKAFWELYKDLNL